MAKVAKSAYEAFDLGILQKGKDVVVVNADQQIAVAKKQAVLMAESGYTKPIKRKDVKVLGKQALGMFWWERTPWKQLNTFRSMTRKLQTNWPMSWLVVIYHNHPMYPSNIFWILKEKHFCPFVQSAKHLNV